MLGESAVLGALPCSVRPVRRLVCRAPTLLLVRTCLCPHHARETEREEKGEPPPPVGAQGAPVGGGEVAVSERQSQALSEARICLSPSRPRRSTFFDTTSNYASGGKR